MKTLRIAAVAILGIAVLPGLATAQDVGVFVSSSNFSPDSGIAAGDMLCESLGTAAIPGSGPWVAWLSTSTADARDRIAQPGVGFSYVRASDPNTVIANNLADLTDGSLDTPIDFLDETGGIPQGSGGPWTGTASDGTHGVSCLDWSTAAPSQAGTDGDPFAVDFGWTASVDFPCDFGPDSIYCFGPMQAVVPTFPTPALLLLALLLLAGGVYLSRRRLMPRFQ